LAAPAFLLESKRRLQGTDLFIVAGGGQLGDYFGRAWGYPFTILKWSLLAKACGAKLAFLSVGAGPINTFLGKRFFRWALTLADYRSFRDQGSRSLIESLGVSGDNHVFPDLVHGLQPAGEVEIGAGVGVIGINPLPFHDSRYWAEDAPGVYERYVQKLATFAVWLIRSGHKVILFPTQLRADPPVIKDVKALVQESLPAARGDSLTCPAVSTFDELLTVIAQTDLVVASRFHGIVLSFMVGRPVIGLSYNQKTDELMTDMGLAEFVADIDQFEVAWLVERFERIGIEAASARARIESRRAAYRLALETQYQLLLGETVRAQPRLALQTA
jgi:polysaccharide pyruvyl transferase WcaK-like protein